MKLKWLGLSIAAALLALYGYCVFYNIYRLQFSLYESFTFAFVQVPLMILTLVGGMIAYWWWTAIILLVGAAVWIALHRRRTHSDR